MAARQWKCKVCGSITNSKLCPDVCRPCKKKKSDLWLSTWTEVFK